MVSSFEAESLGMELDSVTRYVVGRGPARSVVAARAAAAARRANGAPGVSSMVEGTRLVVRGRMFIVLTLARPGGGFRMAVVDTVDGGVRELWSSKVSRREASVRHYGAVRQYVAQLGATVVDHRGGSTIESAGLPTEWASLRVRLEMDAADAGAVGQIARLALDRLGEGDMVSVVVEALDAAGVDDCWPLAAAAGAWLRILGYDVVRGLVPEVDAGAYGQAAGFDVAMVNR